MSMVLLDTNIVSYLFKRDTRAELYAEHLRNRELAIAVMTVAELFQWAAVRIWGEARVARLEQYLERYTLLPVDVDACRSRRKMPGSLRRRCAIACRSSPITPMTSNRSLA